MNFTELARQVNIPTPELRGIIPQLGFDIGQRAIQVDDHTAKKIIEKLNTPAIREKYLNTTPQPQINNLKKSDISLAKNNSEKKVIEIGETIVVKQLAQQMNLPVTKLVLELMRNGVMASLNQSIDYETATIIAEDMGFLVKKTEENKIDTTQETKKRKKIFKDESKNLIPRPPVITIMGHVDHGKTKLLDALRETNLVDAEAGGITQHIGAYTIEKNNQPLTFIDTPGHEAFSAMRSRGAQVADIVILVVAADDGVQPQTIESISHIRSAKLPFIIALNKIDKPEANLDKIKSELAELDLTPEDWGGKTICVEISAKAKINIDGLLETLLLVYEMEKENITANPNRPAVGTIVESHLDKNQGPLATVLVQTGTLHIGDCVKIGNCLGKIKKLKDWLNNSIDSAGPSIPAEIMGLKSVPQIGEILEVVDNIKQFKKELKENKNKAKSVQSKNKTVSTHPTTPDDASSETTIQTLNLILKTDVLGSQEALLELFDNLQQTDLKLKIISCGLGNINEKDIEQAEKFNALLLGFNIKPTPSAEELAREKNIEIKTSRIIYDILDYLKEKMNTLFESEIIRETIGEARVLKIFRTEKKSQIIGCKILSGKITAQAKLNIFRNNEFLGSTQIDELQSGKQNVTEVLEGQEAGLKITGFNEVQEKDILEIIKEQEIKRKI